MKRLLPTLSILVAIILTNSLSAQNIMNKNILQGEWLGKITTNGIDLRLIFNLKLNDRTAWLPLPTVLIRG